MIRDRIAGYANRIRQPRIADLYIDYFNRNAQGKSVADIGAMWAIHGAYSFAAAEAGAKSVTAVDVEPAPREFLQKNEELGNPVNFALGDLMDPDLSKKIGVSDIVFCSGVLYHLPDPFLAIKRLRALTSDKLLLSSQLIKDGLLGGRAVFYPALGSAGRSWHRFPFVLSKMRMGLDSPFLPEKGYSNWFWGLSPTTVKEMLVQEGFVVQKIHHRPTGAVFECSLSN